jgi:hypothetical protein
MEGWSSMRFWSIEGQDSTGHLENEIHFQRGAGGPRGAGRYRILLSLTSANSAPDGAP